MENKEILENLEKIITKERIKQNEPMSKHTSFKIGGPAEFFIKILSIEELQKKGEEAKKFVLENKNNMIQTEKIIEFLRRKITNEKI